MDRGASTSLNLVGSPWTGHGDQSGRPGDMQRPGPLLFSPLSSFCQNCKNSRQGIQRPFSFIEILSSFGIFSHFSIISNFSEFSFIQQVFTLHTPRNVCIFNLHRNKAGKNVVATNVWTPRSLSHTLLAVIGSVTHKIPASLIF